MGWQIAQKDGKYRIWSTISGAWLSEWISREEVLKLHHQWTLLDFKKEVIRQYLMFPSLLVDHETGKRIPYTQEQSQAYGTWMDELARTADDEAYSNYIEETYDKIMKELEKTE